MRIKISHRRFIFDGVFVSFDLSSNLQARAKTAHAVQHRTPSVRKDK